MYMMTFTTHIINRKTKQKRSVQSTEYALWSTIIYAHAPASTPITVPATGDPITVPAIVRIIAPMITPMIAPTKE